MANVQKSEFELFKQEMKADFNSFKQEMKADFNSFKQEMKLSLSNNLHSMLKALITTNFVVIGISAGILMWVYDYRDDFTNERNNERFSMIESSISNINVLLSKDVQILMEKVKQDRQRQNSNDQKGHTDIDNTNKNTQRRGNK